MNGPFIYTSTFNLVELKLKLLSNSNPHSRILTRIFVEVFQNKERFWINWSGKVSQYSMKKYAKALPNNLKNNRQNLSKLGISREINEFFPSIFNNNFNGRLEKSK